MNLAAGTETLLEQSARLEVRPSNRSWRPYPEYRPSGVAWLGDVPAHWQAKRLKFIARTQFSNVDKKSEEGQRPVRLCNYVDVYYHDRITANLDFMEATAEPREAVKFQLQPGDVLVTKDSEDPNDICVPAVVAEPLPGVLCGYHLAQVRPHAGRVYGPYLAYAFASSGIRDQFRMRANGITRFGLSQDDICSALFPVPPLPEQRAIAAFLDRKTRQIDELIERKRRLIELLQEKRTALISHAVTKGLNPDAPMKPSGVKWLGDVPAHWACLPLKRVVKINPEDLPETTDPHYEIAYVDIGNVTLIGGIESTETYRFEDAPSRARRKVRDGDTIISTVRTYLRAIAQIRDPQPNLVASTGFAVLRPEAEIDPGFLYRLTQAEEFVGRVVAHSTGVGYPAIAPTTLGTLHVWLPPVSEQRAIAAFLDRKTREIDAVAGAIDEAITHLVEYRQAVISAAVTGRIDVREEEAR